MKPHVATTSSAGERTPFASAASAGILTSTVPDPLKSIENEYFFGSNGSFTEAINSPGVTSPDPIITLTSISFTFILPPSTTVISETPPKSLIVAVALAPTIPPVIVIVGSDV